MRQVTGLISTYSSDEFGICSALYELGGMVVMHDASGCNSTYTTHDEPRWYDMDSMIFISAISEMEAILGDDDKFIQDLVETADELHPQFIALVGAPIPYMIGTDLDAISEIVSERTGIPCFGFPANGMNYYTKGVSMALEKIVRNFAEDRVLGDDNIYENGGISCKENFSENRKVYYKEKISANERMLNKEKQENKEITVNILGATPLDFSLNGSVDSIKAWIADYGMKMGVCLSMGCTLEDVKNVGSAQVNLVISYGGLAAAKYLQGRFGIPYVVGVPFGDIFSKYLAEAVRLAARTGESRVGYQLMEKAGSYSVENCSSLAIIGENVFSASLAAAIEMECDVKIKVLCPVDTKEELLREGDMYTPEEDDLMEQIEDVSGVIADPLYRSLISGQKFYPLPHEAFSGRLYDQVNPNLIGKRLFKSGSE